MNWLYSKIKAAQANPALADKFKTQMMEVPPAMDSAEFTKFVAQDTAKWSQLIKSMNLKLD